MKHKSPKFFKEPIPNRYFPLQLAENRQKTTLKNFGTILSIGIASGYSTEFRMSPALHAYLSGISPSWSLLK